MSVGNNPSWLAVKPLHNTMLDLTSSSAPVLDKSSSGSVVDANRVTEGVKARIQTLQVPVHYGSVLDLVPRIHGLASPPSPAAHFWNDARLDPDFGGKPDQHYPQAYPEVQHPESGWDVVIHVGVGRQGSLRCETQAHKTGYSKPDANGEYAPLLRSQPPAADLANAVAKYLCRQGGARGFDSGYEAFGDIESTRVGVSQLISWLKQCGMQDGETDQSFDAGRYLCDFIYYCSLCEAKRRAEGTLVLFIHVPPADRNLAVERCTQAIRAIAWFMARQKANLR